MNRLKLLREEKGLYQKDIAKLLNVSVASVNQYESGKRDMSTATVLILAEYFNVSTDYLLGKSDIRNYDDIDIEKELLNIGLNKNDYIPPTKEQQEKIEEFAKFVLKDNLRKKEEDK